MTVASILPSLPNLSTVLLLQAKPAGLLLQARPMVESWGNINAMDGGVPYRVRTGDLLDHNQAL
jgi:hypothetical protein